MFLIIGKTDDVWSANTKPGAEESPRLTTPEPQPKSDGWVTLEPAFQKSPTQVGVQRDQHATSVDSIESRTISCFTLSDKGR